MNETVNVSIASIGFVFDKDAYDTLKEYLDRISRDYADDPDGPEIMADIEAGIVEIILTRQSASEIVTRQIVNEVIGRMGTPEDLGTQNDAKEKEIQKSGNVDFPKRLYRNPDGAKLGGVLNGLATFFNADPVWFRLGIFAPAFLGVIAALLDADDLAGGLWVCEMLLMAVYVLMWMVVPKAKTPRQRLEMQGQKVTVSGIENGARGEQTVHRNASRQQSVFSELISLLGRIIVFSIKAMLFVVGVVSGAFALGMFAAVVYALFHGTAFFVGQLQSMYWVGFDVAAVQIPLIVSLVALMLPAVIFTIAIFGFIFNFRVSKVLMWILVGLWLAAFGYSVATAPGVFRSYRTTSNIEKTLQKLSNAGYDIARDDAGNITVLGETIISPGEDVTLETFVRRVNDVLGPEVRIAERSEWFGSYRISSFKISGGPKLDASKQASQQADSLSRVEAEQEGIVVQCQ